MPKKAEPKSDLQVRRITKPGFHPVGGVAGLLLKVSPNGSRSWVLRFSTGEVRMSKSGNTFLARHDMGLGGYPDVGLSGARDAARDARALIRQGINPITERRKLRDSLLREQETRITFREAWKFYWRDKQSELGKKTQAHWTNSVERYAIPVIGSVIVSDLENYHIEKVLRPIWETKTMTAKKLRGRLEAILSWATVKKYRQGDNPARWGDNLKELLPKPSKIHRTKHYRALTPQETPAFISDLKNRAGNAARALEFLILTACRSGEVRGARWDEIDMRKGIWSIPAERMKMDQPHTVPLSKAALDLLDTMPKEKELIFLSPTGKQLSDMTLLAVLKRMGAWYKKSTVHGFRSSFKGFAEEETDFPHFISEMALAHSVGDSIQQAYRRSDLVGKRLAMMREWAQYLGYGEQSEKVVQIEART